VECFERAALAAPERGAAWFGLGVSLLHERRGAEARAAFGQSLKLRPEHVPSLAGEAAALQMTEKFGPALAIYRRLLDEKPDLPELLANGLAVAVELRERSLVREWAGKLLELDPRSRTALLAQAVAASTRATRRKPCAFAPSSPRSLELSTTGTTWVSATSAWTGRTTLSALSSGPPHFAPAIPKP